MSIFRNLWSIGEFAVIPAPSARELERRGLIFSLKSAKTWDIIGSLMEKKTIAMPQVVDQSVDHADA